MFLVLKGEVRNTRHGVTSAFLYPQLGVKGFMGCKEESVTDLLVTLFDTVRGPLGSRVVMGHTVEVRMTKTGKKVVNFPLPIPGFELRVMEANDEEVSRAYFFLETPFEIPGDVTEGSFASNAAMASMFEQSMRGA